MCESQPSIRRSVVAAILSVLTVTACSAAADEKETNQPIQTDVGGFTLNNVLIEPSGEGDLPPIVFLHGASTSLLDSMYSFKDDLCGRAELLFLDRPGHGNSQAGGRQNILPDGQADAIATLMARRGVIRAIIVAHSFGGAVAVALAMKHPEMVLGIVFLSPAVYPWEGGVAWYYRVANRSVLGVLFSTLVVPPLGALGMDAATRSVFEPNHRPDDYVAKTKAFQALRPANFRHNAQEIYSLSDWARLASKDYRTITVPSIIITGDADKIVSPGIHSRALANALPKAELIVVHGLGHKSDFVARELAISAIEKIAGAQVDLQAKARQLERKIAGSLHEIDSRPAASKPDRHTLAQCQYGSTL